jgi:DNA polymerase III delta prime subunit
MAFKIIVLDGADLIPPSAQQILKKVIHDQEGKVKYIFICRDQTKLIGHILSRGLTYRTRSMSERDAVGLSILPRLASHPPSTPKRSHHS